MRAFDFDKMLFSIPADKHSLPEIKLALTEHPEVRFVSFVGVDIGGHDTDEKIPARAFLEDMEKMLQNGVQTDGSSVVLPGIATLNNAKIDIIPDMHVNWYVDQNYGHVDYETGLPTGTLRIPSFLVHNETKEVGSRVILRDAIKAFKQDLMALLKKYPYVCEELAIDSPDDIEELVLTSATELEFWVKTPDEKADRREELSTSQVLKEQYWKRTVGPVRTALEDALLLLDEYGFEVEMGHKEVGGVKASLGSSGTFDHVMEQLEIDWKFTEALQAADNENQVKYIVRDIFRQHGLEVTYAAKPIDGVAGSGEHTHLGVAAKLKDGRMVNLFSHADPKKEFLSPLGYGAIMGFLKNYEVINPFVSCTNDAFNRLKPGFEAPVCTVTSLGHEVASPSRNRTILIGLVRDVNSPMATRFEMRSPNPKSNTYLVIAGAYLAMLDGIEAVLAAGKTSHELEKSLSKEYGEEDFYLEKDRVYRTEKHVFDDYTQEERDKFFGRAPATVWENLKIFMSEDEKLKVLQRDDVMPMRSIESYYEAELSQWKNELHNRILPNCMDVIRDTVKLHDDQAAEDVDILNWKRVDALRRELGKNTMEYTCLLKRIGLALDEDRYDEASDMQLELQQKMAELSSLYSTYKKNLF
ncbi:MAG: glutamine synthetase [Firmicutes bacterium]|nr:glutamine synthetase [Bacillota bacterium]MBQ3963998.1 glutamine synthetase [Bacillota bacterium]